MQVFRTLAIVAAFLAAMPLAAADETATAEKPEVLEFGDVVDGLEGEGPDGSKVALADLAIDEKKVEAAIMAAAKALGGDAAPKLDTTFSALPGLKDGDELDETKRDLLIGQLGKRFGLIPSEKVLEESKTLADLKAWVMRSEKAPILVVVWSPRCPMCKGIYDERMVTIAGETGIRVLAVAANYPDKPQHVADYLEANDYHWNVIMDPDQKLTNRLGGRKTPHAFLLDKDHKLLYKGTFDNDPRDRLDMLEKKEYVREAIDAIKHGKAIPEDMNDTEPAG